MERVSVNDLVANVRERIGKDVTIEQTKAIIRNVVEEIRSILIAGGGVNLHQLGTLKAKIAAYRGANRVLIKFVPSKELIAAVQGVREELLEHRRKSPPKNNADNLRNYIESKQQARLPRGDVPDIKDSLDI